MPQEVISFQCGEFAGGHGPGSVNRGCPDCGPEEPTLPTIDPDGVDGERPTLPTVPTPPQTGPTTPELPGCVCRVVGDGIPDSGGGGSSGGGGPTTGGGRGTPEPPGGDVGEICLTFEQKCFPEATAPDHSGSYQQAVTDAENNGGQTTGQAGGACTGIAPVCCEDTPTPDDEPCCPPVKVCIPKDRPSRPGDGIDPSGTPPTRPRTSPTTPGPTDGWRCVDTAQTLGCIYSLIFGPNETRYSSKAECERFCVRDVGPPGPGSPRSYWKCVENEFQNPITPVLGAVDAGLQRECMLLPLTAFGPNDRRYNSKNECEKNCRDTGGPVTPGSGGYICVDVDTPQGGGPTTGGVVATEGTTKDCVYTNLPPAAGQRRYTTKEECDKNCDDDSPPGDPRGPGTPDTTKRWYCEDRLEGPITPGGFGSTKHCVEKIAQGDGGHRTKEKCEKLCRDDPPRDGGGVTDTPTPPRPTTPDKVPDTPTTPDLGGYKCRRAPYWNCYYSPTANPNDPEISATERECEETCKPPPTTPTPGVRKPTTAGAYRCRRAPYWNCYFVDNLRADGVTSWGGLVECQTNCTPGPDKGRPDPNPGGSTYSIRWRCIQPQRSGPVTPGGVGGSPLGGAVPYCDSYLGPTSQDHPSREACEQECFGPDDPGIGTVPEPSRPTTPLPTKPRETPHTLPTTPDPTRPSTFPTTPGPEKPTLPGPTTPDKATVARWVCEAIGNIPHLGVQRHCVRKFFTDDGVTPLPGYSRLSDCLADCETLPPRGPISPGPTGPGTPTPPSTRPLPGGPVTPESIVRWVCEVVGDVPFLGVQRRCVRKLYEDTGGPYPGEPTRAACVLMCTNDWDPGAGPTIPTTPGPTTPGPTKPATGPATGRLGGWVCPSPGSQCVWSMVADPTSPTVWRGKAACDGQCITAIGPSTGGGGGGGSLGGYVCMTNSQGIALGCAYDQSIPSIMADGASYAECMKICMPDAVIGPAKPTTPTGPTGPTNPTPPSTGGGTLVGYNDWWTCGLPLNEECQKVSLPDDQPAPPQSYDNAADCWLNCVRDEGPPTPESGAEGPRMDPWWVCPGAAGFWECFPVPQGTLGAYPTSDQCLAVCVPILTPDTSPPGPGGGGGPANTPDDGMCNCRVRGEPTTEVSYPDDAVIFGEVISETGFPQTIEVEKCWSQRCIYTGPGSDPDNDENSDSWDDEMSTLEDGPDGWSNQYGDDNYDLDYPGMDQPGGACEAQAAHAVGCCTGNTCCDDVCITWRYTLKPGQPGTGGDDHGGGSVNPPTLPTDTIFSFNCEIVYTEAQEGPYGEGGAGAWTCVPAIGGQFASNQIGIALGLCQAVCGKAPPIGRPKPPGGGGPAPGGAAEGIRCVCKPTGGSTLQSAGSFIDADGNHCLRTIKTWKQKCEKITTVNLPPGSPHEDDFADSGWTQVDCPGAGTCWTDEDFEADDDYEDDIEDCEEDPNCTQTGGSANQGCVDAATTQARGITTCCKENFWRPCCADAVMEYIKCDRDAPGDSVPPPGGGGGGGGAETGGGSPGGPGGAGDQKFRCVNTGGQRQCVGPVPITQFGPNETRHDSLAACERVCFDDEEDEDQVEAWVCFAPEHGQVVGECKKLWLDRDELIGPGSEHNHKTQQRCLNDPDCKPTPKVPGTPAGGGADTRGTSDSGKIHSGDVVYGPSTPTGPVNVPTIAGQGIATRPGMEPGLNIKDSFVRRVGFHKRRTLDLNNVVLAHYGAKKRPTASTDRNTAITLISPYVSVTQKVHTGNTKIFSRRIPKPLYDLLKTNNTYKDWDSNLGAGVTTAVLEKNLNTRFLQRLARLRSIGGTPIPLSLMLQMVKAKILDGTIGKFDMIAFKNLVKENGKIKAITLIPSSDKLLNETIALGLIENAMIPLDPAKSEAGRDRNMMELWKTLPTDLDKGLPIKINKPHTVMNPIYCENKTETVVEDKGDYCFPVDDGDIVKIGGRNFEIQDGDYINVRIKGSERKLKLCSERGHAYIIPRGAKEQALHLLGGNTYRTLHTESTSAVEFNHSLNLSGEDPREDAYIFKLVPSAIESNHTSFKHVIESSATYSLFGTNTEESLKEINDWVKYKVNHKVFYMAYDDVMLDHIISTQKLVMKQHDVIVEGSKKAKNIPLLTRQIPYYIIIFPTNRQKYMLANTKSTITSFTDDGVVSRELTYSPSLNPKPGKAMSHDFITYDIAPSKTNILGEYDAQAREVKINYTTNTLFKEGYEASGKIGPKIRKQPARKETSLRLAYNIVNELVTNYNLYQVRRDVSEITTFDLFSRMTQTEFNKFIYLENSKYLMPRIRDGLLLNVRVASPTRNDGISFVKKTKIKSRIPSAPSDIYFPIKATRIGLYVIPPTTISPWSSTFGGFDKTEGVPKPNMDEAKKKRSK